MTDNSAELPSELPEQFGRYRIVREIGRGGMGVVFLAEDTALDRNVALKIPTFGDHTDERTIKRFLREARTAAKIKHENVCAVHDVGQVDGRHYLTMEFIEGVTLGEWMQQNVDITVDKALEIVKKVALGVHAAHVVGIIHRDLKPGNVLMAPDGEPYIVDFGMARRFDRQETILTMTGTIAGTPAYMAPEQITGKAEAVGPGVDIYALGILLYELLTGWTPFTGNAATMLGSIVSEPPPPLRSHAPELPEGLEGICAQALAKSPDDRYASAAKLAAAIEAFQDGSDAPPPPDSSKSESRGLFRRLWGGKNP